MATIALEEGPRLLSTVVDCEQSPTTLLIDMPLTATWRKFGDGPKLLCFHPAGETA
ncbi:MAG: OB-fold domain-containing protein [Sphingomonas sp.]|nr:OB-fold domain-containing protein [Sphingomonas sp.]